MPAPISVLALTHAARDVGRFLAVPYPIYRTDPHWVAPLEFDLRKVFTDANPLFQHATVQLWVARQDGRDVGRIAGIVDQNFNRVQNQHTAFFGFFESANDPAVAAALFDAVAAWARTQGLDRLLGPMNPTSNDECGLLVDGFDSDPVLMMPYNPPHYPALVEGAGFRKAKDLIAFRLEVANSPLDRLKRIAVICRKRHPEVSFRAVTKQTLTADLAKVKDVYNAAWETNWGFTPMTDAEIDFMADRLKPLLTPGLIWLAETEKEPIGFLLATLDFNQALKHLRGRLLTPGLLRALPYFLGWRRPDATRVITLGVKASWRNRGLESVMLVEGLNTGIRLGVTWSEASWVLEDNVPMRRVIELFGARAYKTYRLYDRPV